jgi:hypothetical protein
MTYTFLPEPNVIHIVTLVVLSFVQGCVQLSFQKKITNDLLPTLLASLTQKKILTCITPLRNMRPPLIYPQLPHLHNHGLAMLACITPFQNMRPLPLLSHLKIPNFGM